MPSTQTFQDIQFHVWSKSFRVIAPFLGPVIHVVGDNDLDEIMYGVAMTVVVARRFQHKLDTEALEHSRPKNGYPE